MSKELEHKVRLLDNALWNIARRGECEYQDFPKDAPKPCDCPVCVAKSALASAEDWRYIGALHERTTNGTWPREAKIHKAWKDLIDDFKLASILQEKTVPSARDWYVATSIVQWLATNVGMTVLEAAGFKYQQWDQDVADRELMQRRQDREDGK